MEKLYDVFLSFKSEDYEMANKLYDYLIRNNLSVFFSRKTLPYIGESEYRIVIDDAMDHSTHMIVVCSDLEYLSSKWVEHEYIYFTGEIMEGRKVGSNIFLITNQSVYDEEIKINNKRNIPSALRQIQVYSIDDINFKNDILLYFKKSIGSNDAIFKNKADLFDDVDFFNLYGIDTKSFDSNFIKKLRDSNNPALEFKAPVGINGSGEKVFFDFGRKEQNMLIYGRTGAGKSNLLQTFILSMAMNYSTDYVNFVLIDYKGGGLIESVSDCGGKTIPHTTKCISTCDYDKLSELITMIREESIRRQQLFIKQSQTVHFEIHDIYQYHALFREKLISESCPHMFIIMDEFAELKAEYPEVWSEILFTAKVGRSLGIHIICSTQCYKIIDPQYYLGLNGFSICCMQTYTEDQSKMLIGNKNAFFRDKIPGIFCLKNEEDRFIQCKAANADVETSKSKVVDYAIDNLSLAEQVMSARYPSLFVGNRKRTGPFQYNEIVKQLLIYQNK